MEWSQQIVLVLLEEYQKREILWKPRHPLYYNTIKKEDAWREISEILNVEVQELKKKIESLKGSFRREKSRVKKGTGTGKGRDQIYISKWFAYESMQFLDDRDDPQKTLTNAIDESYGVESDDNTEQEQTEKEHTEQEQIADDPDAIHNSNVNIESSLLSSEQAGDTVEPKKLFKSPQKRSWSKTKVKEDPRLTMAFNYLEKKSAFSDRPKDDCQLFADYVANKIRKFNDRYRATAQHRISNVLFELEMEQYNFFRGHQEYYPQQLPHCAPPMPRSSTPLSTASSSTTGVPQLSPHDNNSLTGYSQRYSEDCQQLPHCSPPMPRSSTPLSTASSSTTGVPQLSPHDNNSLTGYYQRFSEHDDSLLNL